MTASGAASLIRGWIAMAVTYRTVRQTLVRRFPYVVCYTFEAEEVCVIAVFHGHRDPSDWRSRAR